MLFDLQKKCTNYSAIIVSLGVSITGIVLVIAAMGADGINPAVKEIVKEIGCTLIGIGVLAFLWEVFTKRSFREETLMLAGVAADLDKAGIETAAMNYLDADWQRLLDSADRLDIFFSYGQTWRNAHALALRNLVKRRNMQVRVILPDPTNKTVVSELARRYSYQPEKMVEHIKEAAAAFIEMGNAVENASPVQVKYTDKVLLYTMYILGDRAVMTTFRHKRVKQEVPTLVLRRSGTFFAFLEGEFDYLWKESRDGSESPTNEASL